MKKIHFNRILFGFDYFISYSRNDGAFYAAALANILIENGYSCLIDQWGTEPGKVLPKSLKSSISKSSVMIILATSGSLNSIAISEEIEIFIKTKRPIIPISFGKIKNADWHQIIDGVSVSFDDNKNLMDATPDDKIVKRIFQSLKYTKQKTRILRTAIAATTIVILAFLIISWFYSVKVNLDNEIYNNKEVIETQTDDIKKKDDNLFNKSSQITKLDLAIKNNEKRLLETENNLLRSKQKASEYLETAIFREKKSFELLNYFESDIQRLYKQPSVKAFSEKTDSSIIIEPIISIYFKNDRLLINSEVRTKLDSITRTLILNKNIKINVKGYSSEYNFLSENRETSLISSSLEKKPLQYAKRLSENYAHAVVDYFYDKGIDRKRFTIQGLGIDNPKYNLDFMNNRVEIEVID